MALSLQQFGQTIKAKYPQYQDLGDEEVGQKVLAQYPQYGDMVNQNVSTQGVIQSGITDLKNTASALLNPNNPMAEITNPSIGLPQKINDVGKIGSGIFNEYKDLLLHPIAHAETHPLNTILDLLPLIKGASSIKAATATPEEMASNAYGMTKNAAQSAGSVNNALLEQEFGTMANPKPELYKGITNAANEGKLKEIIRKEIASQGRTGINTDTTITTPSSFPGETIPAGVDVYGNPTKPFTFGQSITQLFKAGKGMPGVTYDDILDLRKGAYNQGKFNSGNPTDIQAVNRNIGRAYSNVLHQGVPETETLDNLYQQYKEASSVPQKRNIAVRAVRYVAQHPYTSYFMGRGIADLLHSLTANPSQQGATQPTNDQFQSSFGNYYKSH